jgi:hypothetical protein
MTDISTGRLVLGSIAAGLVINVVESIMNIFVLAGPMEDLLVSRNLPQLGGAAMGGFILLAFVLGFLLVWTYSAIRPRYGAGPRTALKAGGAVWAAFYMLGIGANWLMGIINLRLFLLSLAYTLPMMLAAGYVGGMVYREE